MRRRSAVIVAALALFALGPGAAHADDERSSRRDRDERATCRATDCESDSRADRDDERKREPGRGARSSGRETDSARRSDRVPNLESRLLAELLDKLRAERRGDDEVTSKREPQSESRNEDGHNTGHQPATAKESAAPAAEQRATPAVQVHPSPPAGTLSTPVPIATPAPASAAPNEPAVTVPTVPNEPAMTVPTVATVTAPAAAGVPSALVPRPTTEPRFDVEATFLADGMRVVSSHDLSTVVIVFCDSATFSIKVLPRRQLWLPFPQASLRNVAGIFARVQSEDPSVPRVSGFIANPGLACAPVVSAARPSNARGVSPPAVAATVGDPTEVWIEPLFESDHASGRGAGSSLPPSSAAREAAARLPLPLLGAGLTGQAEYPGMSGRDSASAIADGESPVAPLATVGGEAVAREETAPPALEQRGLASGDREMLAVVRAVAPALLLVIVMSVAAIAIRARLRWL